MRMVKVLTSWQEPDQFHDEVFGGITYRTYGEIYGIKNNTRNSVKIGWSLSPKLRLAAFQTAHQDQLKLIARFVARRESEKGMHELFSDLRISGEWFRDEDNIVSEILIEMMEKSDPRFKHGDLV